MQNISIIIPIFNAANFLARCIDSVIAQTLQGIEIILATDGPEICDSICQDYAAKDNRIKLIMHPGGYGLAINQSINVANGEYIGIVEADDWVSPVMFERLYAMAVRHDADVCKGAFYVSFDENPEKATVYTDIPDGEFSLGKYPRILSYQPSIWSAIYKRSFLNDFCIRFMEKRISYVDTPFHLETFIRSRKTAFVNKPLYYYYQDNPDQSVKSKEKPLDGLESEEFFYSRVPLDDIKNHDVFVALVFTAAIHMHWNYMRLTSWKNRQILWRRAHSLARRFSGRPIVYKEFSRKYKWFFLFVKHTPHHLFWELAEYLHRSYNSFKQTCISASGSIRKKRCI
jgi:glycosyltransferase involved in cell wall biosynthesis